MALAGVVKIWKNEQGDFEREIIIRDGVKYTNVRLYEVNGKIWVVSTEQKVLMVDPDGDFVFEETDFLIASTNTGYFTVLNDGRYLKKDTRQIWKDNVELYRIPEFQDNGKFPVMKNESKTLIPMTKQGESDSDEIGFIDFNYITEKSVIKGL